MAGALAMAVVCAAIVLMVLFVVGTMIRSIRDERSDNPKARNGIARNFGLSLAFCALFFVSWIGQGVVRWQEFTDEARTHGESAEIGGFMSAFSKSTLENWQSEFLQLFSFVALSALYVHKGSSESKDSGERMEAALNRIENKLGTSKLDDRLQKQGELMG